MTEHSHHGQSRDSAVAEYKPRQEACDRSIAERVRLAPANDACSSASDTTVSTTDHETRVSSVVPVRENSPAQRPRIGRQPKSAWTTTPQTESPRAAAAGVVCPMFRCGVPRLILMSAENLTPAARWAPTLVNEPPPNTPRDRARLQLVFG